ncbi:MAG: hypothetical protein IJQ85_08530 [Selenomonadaceae bacterium]|nr:hypothetical protein [Selenomonadaceae bacterium]
MADVKTKIERLDNRMSFLEQQVSTVAAKVDMLIVESQQQREDIRRAQEKHDAEMKEMNQRFYQKFDATDKKIDDNAKEFTKQLHTNFVQTMIGVGAIMAAVGGLIIAALK